MNRFLPIQGPEGIGGHEVWRSRLGDVHVVFAGRGPAGERDEVLKRVAADAPADLAWARQVHSATVLPARPGPCGDGDALWTSQAGLALSVVTADCVPVVLAGPGGASGHGTVAAVHAGWRGLVDGVIAATLRELPGPMSGWTAWIGPAIGVCCYEVGEEVAERVVAVSSSEAAAPGPNGRPHLDLPGVAARQLREAGVGRVLGLVRCTRCDEERLFSYRREGKGGGRNLAFIWKSEG